MLYWFQWAVSQPGVSDVPHVVQNGGRRGGNVCRHRAAPGAGEPLAHRAAGHGHGELQDHAPWPRAARSILPVLDINNNKLSLHDPARAYPHSLIIPNYSNFYSQFNLVVRRVFYIILSPEWKKKHRRRVFTKVWMRFLILLSVLFSDSLSVD